MELRFIGIDPDTNYEGSPTVWVDGDTNDLIVQGLRLDPSDLQKLAAVEWVEGHRPGVPDHEAVVRLPARMVQLLREACDAIERSELR
ncbi:hypothetical protein ABT246_42560 [Streptomyces sp. NPDC001553]|uniref:hypothetical protein n=1 Tax=Streptomyces TaxID=1883 RepID=UPI0033279E91